jgi:uncharacterized membrane protein
MTMYYSPEKKSDGEQKTMKQSLSKMTEQVMQINVTAGERWLSALGGGALAFFGTRRRDWMGITLIGLGSALAYRAISGHSFLYQILHRDTLGQRHSLLELPLFKQSERACVQRSMTINGTPEELYTFWRRLENAPRFIPGVLSVTQISPKASHWRAAGPRDKIYEWNAELTTDEPGKCIAWQMHGESPLASGGSVKFTPAPGSRGTIVTLGLDVRAAQGPLNKIINRVSEVEAREILRRFKEVMEAGEIATAETQVDGHHERRQ